MKSALLTSLAVLGFVLVLVMLHGCAAASIDDPAFSDTAAKLAKCRAEGRDAGSYDAYDACKKREGL